MTGRRVAIRYGRVRKPKPRKAVVANYDRLDVYVPKTMSLKLEALAKALGVPKSRLITYALFNEFEMDFPFRFDLVLPQGPAAGYAKEAGILYEWLKLHSGGMNLDVVIITKDDIGITDKDRLLGAVKYLVEQDVCELVPSNKYGPGVKHLQLKEVDNGGG